jgi:hypothetical protein
MARLGAVATLRTNLISEHGDVDNLGQALLTEEGLILEGYVAPTVGISWEELNRILKHPFVQEKLEQAWFEDVVGG